MAPAHDLTLLGWRLRSELPVEILPAWTGDPDHAVEVTLAFGTVPRLADEGSGPVHVFVQDDDSAIVIARGIGRFHVRGGSSVIAEPEPGAPQGAIEMIVIGPVLGTLCAQRGILTLHANTVAIGGCAVALCGPSGAGKSTLAALLASRGHALVSDDVLPVWREGGVTVAQTGNRHLRLWRETLEWLGHDADGLRRAAVGLRDKYYLAPPSGSVASRHPLAALVWIDAGSHEHDRIEVLRGVDRAQAVLRAIYRITLAKTYNRRGRPALGDVSLPGVAVCAMRRHRGFDRLEDQADRIEALVRGGA